MRHISIVFIVIMYTISVNALDYMSVNDAKFTLYGAAAGSYAGSTVAVCDVNGDGIDDMITSAPLYSTASVNANKAGAVYVIFGVAGSEIDPKYVSVDLRSLGDKFGFAVNGNPGGSLGMLLLKFNHIDLNM